MSTRVPRPMYTGSPFESSSTAGSRMGVLFREVRRRVAPRQARGHATTASFTQAASPSTSLREPEPHSHNDDDLDNGDQNPYPDFHVDPRLLVDRAYPRPRVEQTSCSFSCASVREVRARLSGDMVGDAITRDVTNRLGLIRRRNAARTSREIPTPAPREGRRREAKVLRPPAFSLRSFHVGTLKRSRSSGSSKPMTAQVW
jgi:hypothetical protein